MLFCKQENLFYKCKVFDFLIMSISHSDKRSLLCFEESSGSSDCGASVLDALFAKAFVVGLVPGSLLLHCTAGNGVRRAMDHRQYLEETVIPAVTEGMEKLTHEIVKERMRVLQGVDWENGYLPEDWKSIETVKWLGE